MLKALTKILLTSTEYKLIRMASSYRVIFGKTDSSDSSDDYDCEKYMTAFVQQLKGK